MMVPGAVAIGIPRLTSLSACLSARDIAIPPTSFSPVVPTRGTTFIVASPVFAVGSHTLNVTFMMVAVAIAIAPPIVMFMPLVFAPVLATRTVIMIARHGGTAEGQAHHQCYQSHSNPFLHIPLAPHIYSHFRNRADQNRKDERTE
jgi:hypothetical protein